MVVQRHHFVDLSQDLRAANPATRRLVRSQAQRDCRRRQKERAEGGQVSLPERPRTPIETSAILADAEWEDADHDAATASGPATRSEQKNVIVRSKPARGNGATKAKNRRVNRNALPSALVAATSKTDVPRSPSTWGTETADPFASPAQLSRMYRLAMIQLAWLRPHVDINTAHGIISTAYDLVPNPMILSGICIAAVGYLDAMGLQPDCALRNEVLFKGRALAEVRQRLAAADESIEDTTVETLCNLTGFALARLDRDATLHLRGLKTLVAMKGGVDTLKLHGLDMMLEGMDLIHAVTFHEDLMHIDPADVFNNPKLPSDPTLRAAVLFAPVAALMATEFQELTEVVPPAELIHMQGFSTLLYSATACLATVRPSGVVDPVLAEHFATSLAAFGPSPSDSVRDGAGSPDRQDGLGRACQMTMAILYNLVVEQTPMLHRRNRQLVSNLYAAMRSLNPETFKAIAYIRAWIVATGIAAASDPTIKSYFSANLTQTFYYFGVGKWPELKKIVLTFLELRKTLEHARDNVSDTDDERFAENSAARSLLRGLPHAVSNLQPWNVVREYLAPASSPPPPPSSSSPISSQPSPRSSQPPPALSAMSSSTFDDDEAADETFRVRAHPVAKHIEAYVERADPSTKLTQWQKSDRGFHIAMFQGDFWFVDQEKPAAAEEENG